ncbi:MAG: hypothetical protein J5656_02620 [Clostridia bacterium]|nr:hypothetical protein [Clostridia bacterium]
MEKKSSIGIVSTCIIMAVLLILLSLITWVVPFKKLDNSVLIVSYVMAFIMICVDGLLIILQIFNQKDKNKRILGLPIIYFGMIALAIQIIVTTLFYILNAFVIVPIWVIIIVEAFVYAFLVLQTVKGFFFKKRIEEFKENNANTHFMDEFRMRLKAIVSINNNKNIEIPLQDLLDTALASDPITNDKTIDSENELLSYLQELGVKIKEGTEEDAKIIIKKTLDTLIERNALCKIGK